MGINFGKGFFRLFLVISFLGTPLVFVLIFGFSIEKEITEMQNESLQEVNKFIDEKMARDEIKKKLLYSAILTSSMGCLVFLIVIWVTYFSVGFIVKGFVSNKKE